MFDDQALNIKSKETMTEMNLQQIGLESADKYGEYQNAVHTWQMSEDELDAQCRNGLPLGHAWMLVDWTAKHVSDLQTSSVIFATNNAEQLHELAVIEAHLEGVAIDVEQSLLIGREIRQNLFARVAVKLGRLTSVAYNMSRYGR